VVDTVRIGERSVEHCTDFLAGVAHCECEARGVEQIRPHVNLVLLERKHMVRRMNMETGEH
jgi:hypothetical protein